MANNDFDIDFDFEKEYGFDPKAFLNDEEYDENIDLTEYSDEELGLKDHTPAPQEEEPEAEPLPDQEEDELPYAPLEQFPREDFQDEDMDAEPVSGEADPGYNDDPSYGDDPAYDEDPAYGEEPAYEEAPMGEYAPEEDEPKPKKVRPPKPKKPKKEFHTPRFLTKFYDLYFAPLTNKHLQEEPQDPNNPRRRRKKRPGQIFKEVYLPPILVCLCMILVLAFVAGSVSDAIAQHLDDKERQKAQLQDSSNAAQLAEQEYQRLIQEAKDLATEYDYDGAIKLLESCPDPTKQEVSAMRAQYDTIRASLVSHSDPTMIPNLSFHVLINDLPRALADKELGGKYNQNFVSTKEFSAILDAIYANGYVLVDWDSFIEASAGVDNNEMFFSKPILLPDGKKPIMLTETMVNYFGYMVDSNKDGEPDAGGAGFANKLVVENGEIKAEYIDSTGAKLVGDYDFVPILETFIKAHPDFVYQGARATLAVTGNEGVFGYRTNTSYIATKSQAYYDQQVAGAKEVAQALRDKGYRLACFTYKNGNYKTMTATQIQEDITEWTKQIATPVLGTLDTFIFAQEGNISAYDGPVFQVLYNAGFRIFVSKGEEPWAEINSTFVRQNRLMVTGKNMQWHKKQFENIFDCAAILDINVRGDVPNN